MPKGNELVVLEMAAAFNEGDMDRFFAVFDPEIEWHDLPTLPGGGLHHGIGALRRLAEDYRAAWADPRIEIDETEAVGARVVARGQYAGAGIASGAEAPPQPASFLFDFRDGLILRVRQFVDHHEALEAAGARAG